MNAMSRLAELALRYAKQRTAAAPPPSIPTLPPGIPSMPAPGLTPGSGTMRFNPDVLLDPSQIEDRRTTIYPGGRAGLGGDMYQPDLGAVAQRYELMRALRNQQSTSGGEQHGKSSRRNRRPGGAFPR